MTCFQQIIISLIRSAVEKGYPVTLPNDFDWDSTLEFANIHQIIPILYYGIVNAGIELTAEIKAKFELNTYSAVMTDARQQHEINALFRAFEDEKIDYMPLKGSEIKCLFPKSEMRMMSDADILIRIEQYEKIKSIVERLGFIFVKEAAPEFIWDKPSALHLELHRGLFAPRNRDFYKYYGDGWKLAKLSSESKCRYELSHEDLYIYLFIHLTKHYRNGGIGIRHMLDLWIYSRSHPDLDYKYIKGELRAVNLDEFFQNIQNTLNVWFNNGTDDRLTDFITNRIFESGSYGKTENVERAEVLKMANADGGIVKARLSKIRYVLFLPYKNMCDTYPILIKCPALLPAMWIVRWLDVLINRRSSVKIAGESVTKISTDNVQSYQQELKDVGLDLDNFRE